MASALIASWFADLWSWFSRAWSSKQATILFLGLDNAGKTTLLRVLSEDRIMAHEPTRHPQQDTFEHGGVKIKAFDMGGHAAARRLWRSYFADVQGIVFMVDASDHARLNESRAELTALLEDEALAAVHFLVMGNKIDQRDALQTRDELAHVLGIREDARLCVRMCSVVKHNGYQAGFDWLARVL